MRDEQRLAEHSAVVVGSGSLPLQISFVWKSPICGRSVGGGKPKRVSTRPGLNTGGVDAFPMVERSRVTKLRLEGNNNSEIYVWITPAGDIV